MSKRGILTSLVWVVTGAAAAWAHGGGFDESMSPVLKEYLAIQQALAADSDAGVAAAAKKIEALAAKLEPGTVKGAHAAHYEGLPGAIQAAAGKLAASQGIAAERDAFKGLSEPMAIWANMANPKDVVVVSCSMVNGKWLQKKGDINNPYMGSKMLGCGEIVGGKGTGDMRSMEHMGH